MRNFLKIYTLNKSLFKNFLYEASTTTPDAKDIKRILDIVSKSGNNILTQKNLAIRMMNTIKDANKMLRRYNAAKELLGPRHIITQSFEEGCKKLGLEITPDNDDDLLPDPDEIKTEEISPEEIQAALDKLEAENKDNAEKDSLYIDEDLLMTMPFEYIKKLLKIKTYFSEQLQKLDVVSKIQKFLEEFKNASKRYDISFLRANQFNLNKGTIEIAGEIYFMKRGIETSYNSYGYYRGHSISLRKINTQRRSLYIDKVSYSILNKEWDLGNSSARIRWESGVIDRQSATEQIAPFLKTLGNAIEKFIKHNKKINDIISLYNNMVYQIYNLQSGDLMVDKYYSDNQESIFSLHHKLAEKIIGMIEDKFNVDLEPSSLPLFPGFRISKITPGHVIFTPYLTGITFYHYSINKTGYGRNKVNIRLSKITNLTYKEEVNALYKFFTNKMGIDPHYVAIIPTNDQYKDFIEIDIRHLANALK